MKRLAAALAMTVLATGAIAADYDPPIVMDEAPEYQPVEIGSGWYLRGDVTYNFSQNYRDIDFAIEDPLATSTVVTFDESRMNIGVSGGIGYHITDYLRTDLTFAYLGGNELSRSGTAAGACGGTETTTTTLNADGSLVSTASAASTRDCDAESSATSYAYDGLLSAYADLGTYAGFTPYVGAGVGLVYTPVKISSGDRVCSADQDVTSDGTTTTTVTFLCDGQTAATDADVDYAGTHYDDKTFGLIYGLSAGLSYRINGNASIDVGYQYLIAPEARYVYATDAGFGIGRGMDFHQVKVGLRYDLW